MPAKPEHLKLLGFEDTFNDGVLATPLGVFAVIYDDVISKTLYQPDVETLTLYNDKDEEFIQLFKIIGGLDKGVVTEHVCLVRSLFVIPEEVTIIDPRKIAILKSLRGFNNIPELR